MGATYCCSQDERKDFSSIYLKNLDLTGIENLADLQSADCKEKYKNETELAYILTKDKLVALHHSTVNHFKNINFEKVDDVVVYSVQKKDQGLNRRVPTVF